MELRVETGADWTGAKVETAVLGPGGAGILVAEWRPARWVTGWGDGFAVVEIEDPVPTLGGELWIRVGSLRPTAVAPLYVGWHDPLHCDDGGGIQVRDGRPGA